MSTGESVRTLLCLKNSKQAWADLLQGRATGSWSSNSKESVYLKWIGSWWTEGTHVHTTQVHTLHRRKEEALGVFFFFFFLEVTEKKIWQWILVSGFYQESLFSYMCVWDCVVPSGRVSYDWTPHEAVNISYICMYPLWVCVCVSSTLNIFQDNRDRQTNKGYWNSRNRQAM